MFKRYQPLFFLTLMTSFLMSFTCLASNSHQGYFNFRYDQQQDKIFLEVDKLNTPFLLQTSLPYGVGSNDIGLDRGQLGDTRIVQFERYGNKILLKQFNTYYRANSNNTLEQQAVEQAFASSVLWGFTVEPNQNTDRVEVDYTPFLQSDLHHLAQTLKAQKQGNFQIDKSRSAVFMAKTKAFPLNTELEALVTFKGTGAGKYLRSVTPENTAVTVHFHHSLVKLPDDNYQTRPFHPYSGFWSMEYADYATAIDQPLIQRLIPRHRLAKQNPNAKVSEPIKPIIYYLDAGVPEPIKSALLDGASWWNHAFEAIGYKNAFQVKILPKNADPMDIRYNVIQWVHRATRGWSYGSSVIDPRTGEIIKGHVTLGSLRVRQDYLIATALTSPFINGNTNTSKQQAMALDRIRQLAAHEVGHTLGLAHNFAASTNNRASVMDYPHPKITIQNNQISLDDAYTHDIGAWDFFTIAYGYSDFTNQDEAKALAKLIQQAKNNGLKFISDPDARPKSGAHAYAHLWDNGSDAISELEHLFDVRQLALAKFGAATIADGTPYSELEQVLAPVYLLPRYQIEAVAKLIGGVDYNYAIKGEHDVINQPVAANQQKQALQALLYSLSPEYLTLADNIIEQIPPKAYGYNRTRESFASNTGLTFDAIAIAQSSAKHTLALLLMPERLARLNQQMQAISANYVFEQLINKTLKQTKLAHLAQKSQAGLVQQNVNQQVVDALISLWQNQATTPVVKASLYHQLSGLKHWLNKQSKRNKNKALSAQYQLLAFQLEAALADNKTISPIKIKAMPPGSPIGN